MSNTFAKQVHKSEIEILWKLESSHNQNSSKSVLLYVDFQVDGIDGVFRVCDSDGVNLTALLDKISGNFDFFKHAVEVGVFKVFEEAYTSPNFHNGWEWQETTHHKLVNWCLLASCTSWFTCPFGQKLPEVQSMHELYPNIQSSGIELLHSWNSNRQPSRVCYFFPNQQIKELTSIYVKQYPVSTPVEEYKAIIQDMGLDPCKEIDFQIVVKEGYESPYAFGKKLRDAIDCESAEIYKVDNVYFVVSDDNTVAFCESTIINSVAKIPADACCCNN